MGNQCNMNNTLLDVGAQCSADSCSYHDFLPIFCPDCSQYFCKDHIHSDLHSCPLHTPEHNAQQEELQRCALDNCNKLSLDAYNPSVTVACPNCQKSFCAEHRHPVSHKCTVSTLAAGPSIVTKNEKARALLAKMSSPTTKSPLKQTSKPLTNPAKLAAHHRVEVMKMRHKAIPLNPKDKATPVPLDQRLHIKVQHDDKVNVFWVRKTLITGRALDLLCSQFTVAQNDSMPVRLFKDGAEAQLQNDKLLSEQVDDGSLLYIALDP